MITLTNQTIKVGLTGGIGSGKSTVSTIFKLLQVPVFHSDVVAKTIIAENKTVRERIIETFGKQSFDDEGNYNTGYIAGIVFNDKKKLLQLNQIIHPVVFKQQANWFEEQSTPYSIVENAILFEANTAHRFDKIIVVQTNDDIRIRRIMERDNVTKSEVYQRFKSQLPQKKKVKLADYVIFNNGNKSLIKQVMNIHRSFQEENGQPN